jgi:formylglycine-generating enzyme required for sulfatase activity
MKVKVLVSLVMALALVAGCSSPSGGDTTPAGPTTISLLTIPGVTAPRAGETPVTSLDASQYTGTVSWSPAVSGTFAASTPYTATITLTPKTGYTLTGVAANKFTVAGLTTTHGAGTGVVTALYQDYTSTKIGTLKLVPAGRFQRDEIPGNESVITKAYYMSATEITREQFLAVTGTDPVVAGGKTTSSTGMTDPVMCTNWYDAIAFCNKLSISEGLSRVYDVAGFADDAAWSALAYASIPATLNADWDAATANWSATGYRLPTEMEWMWAAMGAPADGQGGGTNTTGCSKAFAGSTGSNLIGDYAWYGTNSSDKTHPAGEKLPNELGLYDMSGNVWEWCWDWYAGYLEGLQTDDTGAASGTHRVIRSGSSGGASSCTVATWYIGKPLDRLADVGFRVVRSAQ